MDPTRQKLRDALTTARQHVGLLNDADLEYAIRLARELDAVFMRCRKPLLGERGGWEKDRGGARD